MKKFSVFLFLLTSQFAVAGSIDSCGGSRCNVGDVVFTYSSKPDPAIACVTESLNAYVTFAVGLKSIGSSEDIVTGETKLIVDGLRKEARVKSLKEALRGCQIAAHHQKVTILEFSDASTSSKVAPIDGSPPYWISRFSIDPIKSKLSK